MTWLDVLLDPAPLIRAHAERGAPGDKHRIGMALLLEAKLSEYEHLARQHGLPSLTSRPEPAPDAVTGLLVALVLHLTGEQDAITRYTDLATSNAVPSDLRTVAAVLASIALSDAGDITRAASLLSDQDSAAESDLERVLLLLHRGLRQAERGDLPDAIVIMERARTLCDTPTGSDRITSALSLVAQRNAQAFRLLAHTRSLTQLIPSRTTSSILMRVDQLIGDALSSYLYNTFDTLVEDPYARTFRWTASDPVDIPLFAALLRAECLADLATSGPGSLVSPRRGATARGSRPLARLSSLSAA